MDIRQYTMKSGKDQCCVFILLMRAGQYDIYITKDLQNKNAKVLMKHIFIRWSSCPHPYNGLQLANQVNRHSGRNFTAFQNWVSEHLIADVSLSLNNKTKSVQHPYQIMR